MLQIPERHPDHVPAHPALPGHRRHHQPLPAQRAQGPRQSHSTGGLHLQVQ